MTFVNLCASDLLHYHNYINCQPPCKWNCLFPLTSVVSYRWHLSRYFCCRVRCSAAIICITKITKLFEEEMEEEMPFFIMVPNFNCGLAMIVHVKTQQMPTKYITINHQGEEHVSWPVNTRIGDGFICKHENAMHK